MTASQLRSRIVAERTAWVREMLQGIRALPLDTFEAFQADPRNAPAAESHLRRALEALLDLGRHVLAKGFGIGVDEYKEIAAALSREGVLSAEEGQLLRQLAGYRNRMVHFYHEVSRRELYEICTSEPRDIDRVLDSLLAWLRAHPELLDRAP
ncbi:MAG: type VII toxin-antitoxin system HepT family RNase toxin [Deferrisomatales bacterium]